jgi:hypothetical protein
VAGSPVHEGSPPHAQSHSPPPPAKKPIPKRKIQKRTKIFSDSSDDESTARAQSPIPGGSGLNAGQNRPKVKKLKPNSWTDSSEDEKRRQKHIDTVRILSNELQKVREESAEKDKRIAEQDKLLAFRANKICQLEKELAALRPPPALVSSSQDGDDEVDEVEEVATGEESEDDDNDDKEERDRDPDSLEKGGNDDNEDDPDASHVNERQDVPDQDPDDAGNANECQDNNEGGSNDNQDDHAAGATSESQRSRELNIAKILANQLGLIIDDSDDSDNSVDSDDYTIEAQFNIVQFENIDDESCSNYLSDQALLFIDALQMLSELGDVIAEGNFGRVFKATFKEQPVAVKKLLNVGLREQCIEAELCIRLAHKNISSAQFFFLTEDDEGVAQTNLVFDYFDKSDLRQEYEFRDRNFSHPQSNKICFEISKALQYLHSRNLVHRDLKPDNIFVSSSNQIKLGDFGFCRQLPKKIKTLGSVGTLPYMAPELCSSCSKHGLEVDIWAMGIMFCELISAADYAPFCYNPEDLTVPQQKKHIRAFVYPKGLLNITDASLSYQLTAEQDFIVRQCLSKKVENRPSATGLLKLFEVVPHELLFPK